MADPTTNKSFNNPQSGNYARSGAGERLVANWNDLDTLLGRFERQEDTLSDTGKAAISGGEALNALAFVVDESNNSAALFSLQGGGNAAKKLWEDARNTELEATQTQDVASVSSQTTNTFTISVTGAETGDPVSVSPPSGINSSLVVSAYVSSSDTVTVQVTNPTSGAIDPSSGDYTVKAFDQSTSFTTTEDNDTTTNVYWDSGNTRYELNNETGGEATYETILVRAV